jgi:hypothetical protein
VHPLSLPIVQLAPKATFSWLRTRAWSSVHHLNTRQIITGVYRRCVPGHLFLVHSCQLHIYCIWVARWFFFGSGVQTDLIVIKFGEGRPLNKNPAEPNGSDWIEKSLVLDLE